ncbi:MAG: alkaline phosphatase family protein [Propionibacteriaceae bacterium]|jgi:hypothetical protein|nr:alkaline phosphatase family protein [Propionibacteriaceae bacterium]
MMSHLRQIPTLEGPFLHDLLGSAACHLGVPGYVEDLVGLPQASKYVVVLVDGLGWENLAQWAKEAPFLAAALTGSRPLVTDLPSTTAASLVGLWTGMGPGRHGVLGFSFEAAERIVSPRYPHITTPLFLSTPLPTPTSVLDTCVEDTVKVTSVVPMDQVQSGFTLMGTRRATMAPVTSMHGQERVTYVGDACKAERALVYVYEPRLDHAGHADGVGSSQWVKALGKVDRFVETLRWSLGADVCLLVTGDHGMVNVARHDRWVIESKPDLARDVRLVGGEARFRHLYTDRPDRVASRWRDVMGDQAYVLTRAEAIDSGVFGPVEPHFQFRIGDVVVVCEGEWAILTRTFSGEFTMVGMHGGCTTAERLVPLLIM